jgi:hypothetical protein
MARERIPLQFDHTTTQFLEYGFPDEAFQATFLLD